MCIGKFSVHLILLHILLQSSLIRNNQEVYIPLWGAPLVLFISPVSCGMEPEFPPVNGRDTCMVWCDSHLA